MFEYKRATNGNFLKQSYFVVNSENMSFGEQFNSNITWIQREYYKNFAIISDNNSKFNEATQNGNPNKEISTEKPKRSRTVYLRSQLMELEKEFRNEVYLRHNRTVDIAKRLGLSKRQVKVWFQNRRMKENRKKEPIVSSSKNTSNTAQENIVQRLMSYAQAEVEKQRVCASTTECMPILSIPEWTVPPPNEIKTLLENV